MKRRFFLRWVFFGFLMVNGTAFTQTDSIMKISLDEATEFALKNNVMRKNAELDIIAAKKKIWETTAIGLPQANAQYNHQYIPGDIPTFPMGEMEIPLNVRNSGTYGVTVTQLIFSGEYIVGLQASKTYKQLAENNLNKTTLDLKETVIQSYFSVLVLEENQKILRTSLKNIQSVFDEVKEIVKVGLMDNTEADQLELTLNNTRNALTTVKRQTELSYELFKILLGTGNSNCIKLTDSIESIMIKLDIEQAPAIKFALQNNIDFRMLETQEKLTFLSLQREKSKFLPTVAAFYNYTDITNAPEIDFTINHIIGLSVEVPVFSSGQRTARVQQAKIELEKTINTREMMEQTLTVQFYQARADYLNALDKYSNEKMNLELSEKIMNNTSVKFKEGMASSMDFTQAQNQFLITQSNYYASIMELIAAKIKMEKLVNNL